MNFFEQPIINSPYEPPSRHWELDAEGRPTNRILDQRRKSELISPVPNSRKKKGGGKAAQVEMELGTEWLSSAGQEYNPTPEINELRAQIETWRNLPNPEQWQVSPETARLLRHWRSHKFQGVRPFFCQVEAVETAIWLAEVAPKAGQRGRRALEYLKRANDSANPDLFRIALKLATGAGKTTVMAMLIAWQVVNAVRHPNSKLFSRGFLIVAPGITIRDRLRVLQPNDPDSYYARRELIPADLLPESEGEDRYHELPRLQAARAHPACPRHALGARGACRPGRDRGNRGSDAPARHAGADGAEEYRRPE